MRYVTASPMLAMLAVSSLLGAPLAAATEQSRARLIETRHMDLHLERVANDLEHPWSVVFPADDQFLISERTGQLVLIDEAGERHTLEGMPEVSTAGQGGLLDLSLHPRFGDADASSNWLYFTWSKEEPGGTLTALSRVRLEIDEARESAGWTLGEPELLFRQDRASSPTHHYGSRLAWLPDETLLMTIGDRGNAQRAQNLDDHAGSVLRLTADGGIPADNPFVDNDDAADALYTVGNRNIQGLAVDAEGRAWASEHAPLTGDELNLLQAGENYGWPEVSQGLDYATREPIGTDSLPGMQAAVHIYEGRFAPSGLTVVNSDALAPWQGNLLAGGLRSEQLLRLVVEDGDVTQTEVILDGEVGRILDVRQGPDGAIYLLEDAAQGSLYRLAPAD